MDLSSLFQLLRRRWLVALPTFLVVGVLASLVLYQPPTQRASSTLVLIPPDTDRTDLTSPTNPFQRFGDISVVVDIVRRIVSSDATVRDLQTRGLDGKFTVTANVDTIRGPLLDITADARTAEAAIGDVGLVVNEVNAELVALQKAQGAPAKDFITSQVIVPASDTTTIYSSMLRRLIVSIALCLGATIGAAIIADAVGRRVRRESETTDASAIEST